MSRITAFCEWLLRQPLVWGGMACFAFQAIVVRNLDAQGDLHRWFAGDGSSLRTAVTLLFFVGLASLAMRAWRVLMEFGSLGSVLGGALRCGSFARGSGDLSLCRRGAAQATLMHRTAAHRGAHTGGRRAADAAGCHRAGRHGAVRRRARAVARRCRPAGRSLAERRSGRLAHRRSAGGSNVIGPNALTDGPRGPAPGGHAGGCSARGCQSASEVYR